MAIQLRKVTEITEKIIELLYEQTIEPPEKDFLKKCQRKFEISHGQLNQEIELLNFWKVAEYQRVPVYGRKIFKLENFQAVVLAGGLKRFLEMQNIDLQPEGDGEMQNIDLQPEGDELIDPSTVFYTLASVTLSLEDREYRRKMKAEGKREINACCENTKVVIEGLINFGITEREYKHLVHKALLKHPLDNLARHIKSQTSDVDLDNLIGKVFAIASDLRTEVGSYFLEEFYKLVFKQNKNSPHLLSFENKWNKRVNEVNNNIKPPQKIIILFLSANPKNTNKLSLDQEVKEISNNIKLSQRRENIIFLSRWAVTSDDLMQELLDESPTIVHFSGHGKSEGIMLEDKTQVSQIVSGQALEWLFKYFSDTIACVILNSCHSEPQAKSISNHIPYVIGMNSSIEDDSAKAFSVGFYKALGAGKNFEDAFKLGKVAISLRRLEDVDLPILLKKE